MRRWVAPGSRFRAPSALRGALPGLCSMVLAWTGIAGPASAQALPDAPPAWTVSAVLGAEARAFVDDPLSANQPRRGAISLVARPELQGWVGSSAWSVAAVARWDASDPSRRYLDVREAQVQGSWNGIALLAGMSTVFWGVTESRHVVDVVNQIDWRARIDGDEKLGQWMIRGSVDLGSRGFVDLFLLTGARAQRYPGPGGRPGVPFPVDHEAATYESRWGRWHPDVAARWSAYAGPFEWAVSAFVGTGREPQYFLAGPPEAPVLVPRYDLIRQAGLEVQWTAEAWLWKAEGIVRGGQGSTYAAFTGGFERILFGVGGGRMDVALLGEYSHDGRDDRTLTWFDDDVFAGARVVLNDRGGSEIVAGFLADLGSDGHYAVAEAGTRLGERLRLETAVRLYDGSAESDPLSWFRADDHFEVTAEYRFRTP